MKEKIIFSSLFLSALILNLLPAADGTFTQKIILSSPDQMIVNSEEEPSFIQNNPIPSSSNDDVSFEPGTVIELTPDDDAAYYPSTDGYGYYYAEDEDVQYDDGSNNGASTGGWRGGGGGGGGSGTITIGDPSSGGFSFGFVTQQPQQGSRGNSYSNSNSQSSSHSATDSSMQAAQNSFMATPLSEQYQEAAYEAFAAVRQNCKADYENICAATPLPFSEFSSPLLNFFGNTLLSSFISGSGFFEASSRRLLDVATLPFNHPISFFKKADIHSKLDAMASKFAAFRNDFKSAAGDSVKSNSNAAESMSTSVSDKKSADVKDRAFPLSHLHLLNGGFNFGPVSKVTQNQLRGNVRKLDDYNTRERAADIPSFPILNSKFFGGPMPPPPSFPAPPAGRAGPGMPQPLQPPQRFPGGPPPMSSPPDAVPGRPCHNDHDHDHHDHDRDHPPSPPPPPPSPENQDNVFKGELLYGVDGDDCMYLNFDSLSDSCQQSIANVYALREEYWSDETANTHPHGPFVAILFSVFLITIFIAIKRSRFNRLRRAKDLAIYNALQANPDLKAQLEAASGVVVEAPPARKSCLCIFLKITGFLILGFVLWAVTAMITITSVHYMVYVDENGNEVYPNPLIPLIIFLVTLTSLLLLSVTIIRSMRRSMCPRYNQSSNNNNNNSSTISSNRFAISNYFRLPAPTFWSTSTGTSNNNSYYVPLNDESTHPTASTGGSREMVIIQQNQQQTPTNYPNNQPRTVVLSNYPPITQCVTPVNII